MLDNEGLVVEGTSSNVFIVESGELITPCLDHCGVQGVMRDYILHELAPALNIMAAEGRISPDRLANAEEVFFCNAIGGILPVDQFDRRCFGERPVTERLIARLNRELYA